jgi:hypothetical protein
MAISKKVKLNIMLICKVLFNFLMVPNIKEYLKMEIRMD